MADAGMKFFSKMLDEQNAHALNQFGITREAFSSKSDRIVYDYIEDYIQRNGYTPSPTELTAALEEFIYIPNVQASFDELSKEIRAEYAKDEIVRVIQGAVDKDDEENQRRKVTLEDIINEKPGDQALDWLIEQLEQIKQKTLTSTKVGKSIKEDTGWFLEEYDRRAEGKSFKVWKSRFPRLNEILGGGYVGGNMYVPYGRSGRGKSIFVLEEAIEMAMQGAKVLYWGLEMIAFELYCRAYSSISARCGLFTKTIKGVDYELGFDQKAMLMAKLDPEFYEGLVSFVNSMNEILDGDLIIRSVDDKTFLRRDIRALEAEIRKVNADVVVIDPVYYMTLERNTSNTAGGDIAATSRKLRSLAGSTGAVFFVVTQAEETSEQYDENGERELRPPRRHELKKSKQLLEDASLTIGIDSLDGRAIIVPGKGRHGGEGEQIELIFLPNYGLIKQIPSAEEVKDYIKPRW